MFIIDLESRIPIYEQIINQVQNYIILGILKPKEQLPSVRELAGNLGINPNTIQKAYSELETLKIIISEPGKGSFVTENINNIKEKEKQKLILEIKNKIILLEKMGMKKEEIKENILNGI